MPGFYRAIETKSHGTGTKTDAQGNEIKTQKLTYLAITIWFSTNVLKA
jgi:hypothetical protein